MELLAGRWVLSQIRIDQGESKSHREH